MDVLHDGDDTGIQWDIHFDSVSNVVEVHIDSLRNRIDRNAAAPLIQTVRGVGYMLTDKPSAFWLTMTRGRIPWIGAALIPP